MPDFSMDAVARGLDRVSDEIKGEVGSLIPIAAQNMVSTLKARYPIGRKSHPGPHMREDIRTRTLPTQSHRLPAIRVTGPLLSFIWQEGTRERFDATRKNARRGRMPSAAPGFFERTAVVTRLRFMQLAQLFLDRPRQIDTVGSRNL